MKARIYLFQGIEDFKCNILPAELSSLNQFFKNWDLETGFIHIGFTSPDVDPVRSCMLELPHGLYTSQAFKDCKPGPGWGFSRPLTVDPQNLNAHFLFDSPLHKEKVINDITNETIKRLENSFSNADTIGELIEREDINLLQEVEWSVRTFNVLQDNNIVFLSDIIEWSENDLMRLQNFGQKCLDEIIEFLQREGLELKKKILTH